MKKIISSLLFAVLVNAVYSQELIFPKLPSDPVNDLYFLTNNEILFVNDGGCIYKSCDAGNTWVRKSYFPGFHLNQINFVSTTTGFVITPYSNDLLCTNDGGDSWQKQQISLSDAAAVLPVSENIIIKSTFDGNILRLDNFYNNWDTVFQMAVYIDSTRIIKRLGKTNGNNSFAVPYGRINKFQKMPNGTVLALGDQRNAFNHNIKHDSLSLILASRDSCRTWDTLWTGLQQFVKDFCFADNNTGWMISDTSVFQSSNGGLTWSMQHTGAASYYTTLFARGENIYLATYDKFMNSSNLGNTWNIEESPGTGSSSIIFNDNNNGFILGNDLYKTMDAGKTWENLNPYLPNDIYDINFISPAVGIALGNKGVYKTYDGGNSWAAKFNPGNLLYNDPGKLEMLNDSSGWLITHYNFYKTEDGGEQWSKILFYNKDLLFNTAAFYKDTLGVLTAVEESIPGSRYFDTGISFVTSDGGKTWMKRSSASMNFDKLKFTDKNHLWGINQSGMWVSYDTAASWKKIYGGEYFMGSWSFDFSDSLYGVVTTSYDQAYLTTDGGISWKTFAKPVGNHPTDCRILGQYISGSQRILETGSDGKILLTYLYPNGVVDFSYQVTSFTGMKLNTIDVLVDNDFPYVRVGGNGFTIWYRQFEKIATDVKRNNPPPAGFALSQNYPNPFNPSTIIPFAIPTKSFVTLKIFDILGQEITTLLSKELPAGNHECEWNATGFVSGVYFYRLQAGSFTATKKVVLLR